MKGKERTVNIPDLDAPFFGPSKRIVFPAGRSARGAVKSIYQSATHFCKSIGLRSVAPCFGISSPLVVVVGASFSLLIRDAVIKCVHFFDKNPSMVYKTRISPSSSRRVASVGQTYPIEFENFAGRGGYGHLGNGLEVKLPRGECTSVFYAKLFLRCRFFGLGPFRRFRRGTGRRFGRCRRAQDIFFSCSIIGCTVFCFESFECWMHNHGSSGERWFWGSGSLIWIRIRYCAWLVGRVEQCSAAGEWPPQRKVSTRRRRRCRTHRRWGCYEMTDTRRGKLRTRKSGVG
jgi:hypothetical protein